MLLAGPPLVVLVLAIGGGLVREHFLGEALVRDVARLSEPQPQAPAPFATPGDMLACLEQRDVTPLRSTPELLRATDALNDFLEGTSPISALPRAIADELPAMISRSHEVTKCAWSVTTSVDWRAIGASSTADQFEFTQTVPLAIRALLERSRADEALALCGGLVAWARAQPVSRGLLGSMGASSLLAKAAPPCVAAIDAASTGAKRDFVVRVQAMRGRLIGFAEVLELERVQMQLGLYRHHLSDAQLQRLPVPARTGLEWGGGTVSSAAARLRWPALVKAHDARIAAARGPARDEELRAIEARFASPLDVVLVPEPDPERWVEHARRHDSLAGLLDFLVLAARIDLREPGAGDGGFTCTLELDGKTRGYLLHPD